MPHLGLVSLSGLRVRSVELAALGARLPGLAPRLDAVAALPPLGLLTLAGATPESWSVTLHEAAAVDDELVERIAAERPRLVAISALTASILEAYSLAGRLEERGIATVLGGLHVTTEPAEAARHARAVVIGEAEGVWRAVLADAHAGELRPVYRATGTFDLARSPRPRFALAAGRARPRFTLQTSRGCPLACEFCGASRLLGPFRRKPVELVRRELAAIRELDPRPRIELADDNGFAAGGAHAELLDVLAGSGARWFTEADWRIGENAPLLERLAAAGCVQVLVGIESPVHEHAGMGPKAAPWTRVRESIEAIQVAGVAVIGCHVVGSDGETEASLERLEQRLSTDPCADVQLTLETPFPGTALRRRLTAAGRLLDERDWSSYTLFDLCHRPTHLSPERLEERFRELLLRAHSAEEERRRTRIRREVQRRSLARRSAIAHDRGEGT